MKSRHDTGLRQAMELFLKEVSFCFRRAYCCSFSEVAMYVPHFVLTPSCRASLRGSLYGRRIIVEMRLEAMRAQLIITLGPVTDFSHPVHTTDRHDVVPFFGDRTHLRTENYTLAVSQAHKFLLGVLPRLYSRSLNIFTVSPGTESGLINTFESPDDPRGAFTRALLPTL